MIGESLAQVRPMSAQIILAHVVGDPYAEDICIVLPYEYTSKGDIFW